MATLPTRLVEIEFVAGSDMWTDVSADVDNLSTRRGRNRELGAFETGTLNVVLRNETRKYDPENAAGPYYGNLRPNRRIRIRATYNAVTYPVFQGYVDQITQEYQGPNGAQTTISASDLFKILNRVELLSSVYAAEVNADAPIHWWRLGEPGGATLAVDSIGTAHLTYYGPPTLGVSSLPVREDDTAVQFTASSDQYLDGTGHQDTSV